MPYIEKRIISGDLLEVGQYYTTSNGKPIPRREKEKETAKGQEGLNNRNAQKRLIRLLNANFDGRKGDLFVTLTYREAVEEKAARREIKNFVRRVQYYIHKNHLPELKYILITEKQGKWHHHIIMNGLPIEVIAELWGRGRVTVSRLDKTYYFEDLGRYLIKDHKPPKGEPDAESAKEPRRKFSRRWSGSLNLKQPTVITKEIKRSAVKTPPAAKKGYTLADWNSGCDIQGNLYMFCTYIKLEAKPKKPQSGRRRKRNVL